MQGQRAPVGWLWSANGRGRGRGPGVAKKRKKRPGVGDPAKENTLLCEVDYLATGPPEGAEEPGHLTSGAVCLDHSVQAGTREWWGEGPGEGGIRVRELSGLDSVEDRATEGYPWIADVRWGARHAGEGRVGPHRGCWP